MACLSFLGNFTPDAKDGNASEKLLPCYEKPNCQIKSNGVVDSPETLLEEMDSGSGLPSLHEVARELRALARISTPMAIAGLLIYARSLISMLFLGYLGETELAAGSLSIGFANITGYSVIFGLAMAMEPICGQAFGAHQWPLLSLTLHRTVIILLCSCLPISLLWLNMEKILLSLNQDPTITKLAQTHLLYTLPDLIAQSFLHPLRIYLRSQSITLPIAICSSIATLTHFPLNFLLVVTLKKGIKGVAVAMVLTNFNLLALLIIYIKLSGVYKKTWQTISKQCLKEWGSFFSLAIPSCISICLEWWWYELMIILCGLLQNPKTTVASIGILIQTTSLVYIFPSSLSLGISMRVANELGAKRVHGARRAAIVGTACGVAMGVAAAGFTTSAQGWWGSMFIDDVEILALVMGALPVVGLCELGNCPQTAMCGVLRGSARPNVGAQINVWAFYGVGLPLALVLVFWFKVGFVGLWMGLLAAEVACALVLGVVVARTDWVGEVQRAKVLTGVEASGEKLWVEVKKDEGIEEGFTEIVKKRFCLVLTIFLGPGVVLITL